jgi:hypothetical protein
MDVVMVIKSGRMRQARHEVLMAQMIHAYIILVVNFKGRDHLEDLGMDGMKILKGILGE